VRSEPGGELAAESGEPGPGDMGPAETGYRLPPSGHDEDDAMAAAGHVPADRGGDVEVRGDGFGHGAQEILELHVDEWCALDVVLGGGVEAGVDAAAGGGDSGGVLLDRRLVENVEACDVSRAAVLLDALGDVVEGCFGAAGEVHFGALAGVRACDGGPDRPAAP
jgi:hypothetical protein